jgi:PAS domain S-box-containing protein
MPAASDAYRDIFESLGDGLILCDSETRRVVEANPAAAAMHGYSRAEFIGLPQEAFLHPDSRQPFSTDAGVADQGKPAEALAVHIRRDGSLFYAEVRRTGLIYGGRPCLLSVVRDVSRRVQAEQLLRQRVETHAREQSVLLETSQTLASALDLPPDLILLELRKIIEYTHAALFVPEDSMWVVKALSGPQPLPPTDPIRIPMRGTETPALRFDENQPIRIADVSGVDPSAKFLRKLLGGNAVLLPPDVRSWMWVPIAVKRRVMGIVGVAHDQPDFFTGHHANLALTVANQAATTMVNADLYGHARELAMLEERQRLAQNLHDAVSQSLFSAGLIAEVLPRLWERDPEEARRSLEDLRRLTSGALAEMRALLAELRPSTLTDAELGDLLRLLGNAFTGRTNIPVDLRVKGECGLPADTQVVFYRVCQEALNNIDKHAHAGRVEIDLTCNPEGLELRIRDDGSGFAADEPTAAGHYGLGMMRERADSVKAVLTINSRPAQGTEIILRWRATPEPEAA